MTMAVSLVAMSVRSWTTGAAPRWALVLIPLTPLSIPAFWLYVSLLPAVGWLGVAKGISLAKHA